MLRPYPPWIPPKSSDRRVTLVSASPEQVVIDVRVDDFNATEVTVEGRTYQRLSLPEAGTTEEIGKPESNPCSNPPTLIRWPPMEPNT